MLNSLGKRVWAEQRKLNKKIELYQRVMNAFSDDPQVSLDALKQKLQMEEEIDVTKAFEEFMAVVDRVGSANYQNWVRNKEGSYEKQFESLRD